MIDLQAVTLQPLQALVTGTLTCVDITGGIQSSPGVTVTGITALLTHDVPVSVLTFLAVVANNILLAGTFPSEGVTLRQLILC